mmetsp:Transcript_4829/g.13647  ORF Transcript_4829/g.13647 Transcript_4829/m.13647 type:complete len:413 (-) Transcript_4829:35-1273(-)
MLGLGEQGHHQKDDVGLLEYLFLGNVHAPQLFHLIALEDIVRKQVGAKAIEDPAQDLPNLSSAHNTCSLAMNVHSEKTSIQRKVGHLRAHIGGVDPTIDAHKKSDGVLSNCIGRVSWNSGNGEPISFGCMNIDPIKASTSHDDHFDAEQRKDAETFGIRIVIHKQADSIVPSCIRRTSLGKAIGCKVHLDLKSRVGTLVECFDGRFEGIDCPRCTVVAQNLDGWLGALFAVGGTRTSRYVFDKTTKRLAADPHAHCKDIHHLKRKLGIGFENLSNVFRSDLPHLGRGFGPHRRECQSINLDQDMEQSGDSAGALDRIDNDALLECFRTREVHIHGGGIGRDTLGNFRTFGLGTDEGAFFDDEKIRHGHALMGEDVPGLYLPKDHLGRQSFCEFGRDIREPRRLVKYLEGRHD